MNKLIDKLAGELMILRLPDGPHVTKLTREEALKNARQIARELFPPMAKPLVWRNPHGPYTSGDYMIAPDCNGAFRATYNLSQIFAFKGAAREALDQCKAACESHHQTRFLEQLA